MITNSPSRPPTTQGGNQIAAYVSIQLIYEIYLLHALAVVQALLLHFFAFVFRLLPLLLASCPNAPKALLAGANSAVPDGVPPNAPPTLGKANTPVPASAVAVKIDQMQSTTTARMV